MNIALYGFMGVGKTTIGRILAEKLGYDFIDVDTEIERETGKSINEIFQLHGEAFFRKLESDIIRELSNKDRLVIACGGGAVTNIENAETLQKSSKMIYLTASIDEIVDRTKGESTRPLLNVANPVEAASELYENRKPIYVRYADLEVDTTDKTIEEVVALVLERIK